MRRLIGGVDGKQKHHRDAGGDGEIGGLGHIAAGRCGHKLRKGRESKRFGHRNAGACRWKYLIRPKSAAAGLTKCPCGGRPSTSCEKQRYHWGRKWSPPGRAFRSIRTWTAPANP